MIPEPLGLDLFADWGGVILGGFATTFATYLLKGKTEMQAQIDLKNQLDRKAKFDMEAQLDLNTQEILRIKGRQGKESALLTQKLESVELELRDLRDLVRDDVGDIKSSMKSLQASIVTLSESQGELRGTITAFMSTTRK